MCWQRAFHVGCGRNHGRQARSERSRCLGQRKPNCGKSTRKWRRRTGRRTCNKVQRLVTMWGPASTFFVTLPFLKHTNQNGNDAALQGLGSARNSSPVHATTVARAIVWFRPFACPKRAPSSCQCTGPRQTGVKSSQTRPMPCSRNSHALARKHWPPAHGAGTSGQLASG